MQSHHNKLEILMTAWYFHGTLAYVIYIYGINFYGINFYGTYFYKVKKS